MTTFFICFQILQANIAYICGKSYLQSFDCKGAFFNMQIMLFYVNIMDNIDKDNIDIGYIQDMQ